MVARPCMLDVMWERKGDCVILSRRFSSRIRTLEIERVLCQRGGLATLALPFALKDTKTSRLPGDNVQNWKEDDKGSHCHKEPRENSRNHSNTEEHQDDVLNEHLSLERQAHINWGNGKGTCVRCWDPQTARIFKKQKEAPQKPYLKFVIFLSFKQSDQRKIW